ncbi:MAG: hypothetical protein K9L17_08260 [Clostridiales bacterium]|nr:hypothetical protein [Clostridiales bacterium]MCF8022668.1 hypothetical protein [Clostridiales bacterium]
MFIKDKRGTGEAVSFLGVVLLIMLIVFNLLPPVITTINYYKLSQIQREALLKMEVQGGMTSAINQEIINQLDNKGFDASKVTINATNAPVDYGNEVNLEIDYQYTYDEYAFSDFSIVSSSNTHTMSTEGSSISLYFEK